uniref:LIN1 n=1 Tax=Poeciliopsis prolifica TaxID=188132 RepID=A0A0S7EYH5_9TELE
MRVISYNCRGLRVGNTAGDKARRLVVDKLLQECDVLCLQETFLSKQDLGSLNCINDCFCGAGESTVDLSMGIVRGRIAGGVAILWHKKLDPVLNVIRTGVDWCIAVHFKIENKEFIIINVYTPYECPQNEDIYLNRLAFLSSFIDDHCFTSVYVVGDMNADISDEHSSFAKHMHQFCDDNSLLLSSQLLLPAESYTYISEAWHTMSWLDHCISSADAHTVVKSLEILYEYSMSDHVPFLMMLDIKNLPEFIRGANSAPTFKINWSTLSKDDLLVYRMKTDLLLSKINLPLPAITCSDVNCSDISHCTDLHTMYDGIVDALYQSTRPYLSYRRTNSIRPGWNKHVSGCRAEAKQAYKMWVQAGKPRHGTILDYKKLTSAKFKYAIRYISKCEQNMRADSMAEKLLCNDTTGFWNDVRALNRSAALLPNTIEGISGAHNIVDLWRQHYSALFNCVQNEPYGLGNIAKNDVVIITPSEIQQAIVNLCENKATGSDGIAAEHLKYASQQVSVLLAMCFSGFMTHGQLPDSLLSVTLVPVIKDKTNKVGSLDNYRPIALASVLSKVLEKILLGRLNQFISTTDNQFGFKAKLGTDFCIYGLKEAVRTYLRKNSSVLLGFIDASKAFDRVNHNKLFDKLKKEVFQILLYEF